MLLFVRIPVQFSFVSYSNAALRCGVWLLICQVVLSALSPSCKVRADESGDAPQLPNVLWLSCEDISPHLGCYGDPHAITPNLDALASRGTRFTHAFTAAGVCAPCRSTIITGMYQNAIGTHHMRCNAVLPEWLTPFPQLLRRSGYYCTNNRKTDYQFKTPAASEIWDDSGSKAHWKNRPDGKPFFAVFNFTGCHESGIASKSKYESVTAKLTDSERQTAANLSTLPPYYPDTPVVREDWKRNYELITAMDHWIAEHLAALEQAGLAENTIVWFWSDHGIGLPRAKRWLYDSGTRIPMIVFVPPKYRSLAGLEPGVDSQLVSSTDFAPTMLSLAGISIPDYMHGRAIMGPGRTEAPQFVHGARDRMDERYDTVRSVRGKRFRYIRNFSPQKPYYQYMNTPEKGATMQAIRSGQNDESLPEAAKLFAADTKPAEELYDLEADPHEIHNLADSQTHQDVLRQMRAACLDWQKRIGDLGLAPESYLESQVATAGSTYAVLRQGEALSVEQMVELAAEASQPTDAGRLSVQLGSEHPIIRYWAAIGLGNTVEDQIAERSQQGRKEIPALVQLLDDPNACVRIAAARALCRFGELKRGLEGLKKELSSDLEWARLEAAIVLDELDEAARPALPELQLALVDQPNKYIVRVANKAINDLLGTENRVP
ncbi:MAG TPA: sulfatase [Planctomycetaceae bacterium]|nr:sulfatase [Planctomycetaceae bacterium]